MERLARAELRPSRLAAIPAEELRRADLRQVGEAIAQRAPYVANQMVALVRRAYNWAVERDLLEVSPVAGIRRVAPTHPRERVLAPEELRALWRALDALDEEAPDRKDLRPVTVRYIHAETDVVRLLALTGTRLRMVLGMRREELLALDATGVFDRAGGPRWAIPGGFGGRTKNKSPHVVPLSPQALAIARRRLELAGSSAFLFPSSPVLVRPQPDGTRPDQPMLWASKFIQALKARTAQELATERARGGVPPAPMVPWTIHGLRQAIGTHMREELGVRADVVSMVLGHRLGGPAATRLYDRAQLLPERRAALVAWADWLERVVRGEAGHGTAEVLPFHLR